ncbi:MAG: type II toxin-antitoxin system HipA family toxin [Bacteroidota bacterium]
MIPDIDLLTVTMDGRRVGQLAQNLDHCALFEYDPEWLQSGFSISPFHHPLKGGLFRAKPDPFDGLFGVFHDSLPNDWGKGVIDRWLREQGVNPEEVSWLERLAIVGGNGMGALRYEPEVDVVQNDQVISRDRSLDFYATELKNAVGGEPVGSLDELVVISGVAKGDRPKVLMDVDDQPWMIKFRGEEDPDDIGKLEYLYSMTAKLAGIEMPVTRLFEDKYFGIRRFDRRNGSPVHMVTASGLLHFSHRDPSLDYTDLMNATFLLTRSMVEVKKVFRRMIFNVLTHNREDHAGNFSYLYRNGTWVCAPAYDLVYSHGFRGNHSTMVLGNGVPDRTTLLNAGEEAGLSRQECLSIVEEVEEATRKLVEMIQDRWGVS